MAGASFFNKGHIMPQITFIEADGTRRLVEAALGESLMQAATRANVAGIIGECGGSCMCATCHCFVEDGSEGLAAPDTMERDTLEFVAKGVRDTSRLTCQIEATDALNGLVLRVAVGD
jgi:2Fe-2S ferredoxin